MLLDMTDKGLSSYPKSLISRWSKGKSFTQSIDTPSFWCTVLSVLLKPVETMTSQPIFLARYSGHREKKS